MREGHGTARIFQVVQPILVMYPLCNVRDFKTSTDLCPNPSPRLPIRINTTKLHISRHAAHAISHCFHSFDLLRICSSSPSEPRNSTRSPSLAHRRVSHSLHAQIPTSGLQSSSGRLDPSRSGDIEEAPHSHAGKEVHPVDIATLPSSVIYEILDYLPNHQSLRDLDAASVVCRAWRAGAVNVEGQLLKTPCTACSHLVPDRRKIRCLARGRHTACVICARESMSKDLQNEGPVKCFSPGARR